MKIRRGREGNQMKQLGGERYQKGWVTKMAGLCRGETLEEGKPDPWDGDFKVEGGVCQSYPLTNRN